MDSANSSGRVNQHNPIDSASTASTASTTNTEGTSATGHAVTRTDNTNQALSDKNSPDSETTANTTLDNRSTVDNISEQQTEEENDFEDKALGDIQNDISSNPASNDKIKKHSFLWVVYHKLKRCIKSAVSHTGTRNVTSKDCKKIPDKIANDCKTTPIGDTVNQYNATFDNIYENVKPGQDTEQAQKELTTKGEEIIDFAETQMATLKDSLNNESDKIKDKGARSKLKHLLEKLFTFKAKTKSSTPLLMSTKPVVENEDSSGKNTRM